METRPLSGVSRVSIGFLQHRFVIMKQAEGLSP